MRLIEAIIDANHRALAGDANAGVHPGDFEEELPIVALTCIDPRLNPLFPAVLGIPADQFIWLRNAGNIITEPLGTTMRSLALACAVKSGKEIAIIGHTDCLVGHTTTMDLIERMRALGVERHLLPDNVNEFFGLFSSVQQNVIRVANIVRSSPLIGPKVPVHGLVVDTQTGKLDWIVDGYRAIETGLVGAQPAATVFGRIEDALKPLADFKIGEMKFPETKIGEAASQIESWVKEKVRTDEPRPPEPESSVPPKIPLPPPIRPQVKLHRRPR